VEFDVLVEIFKGECNKYEVDYELGWICLDCMFFILIVYLVDYGFIEDIFG